ncbi:reverse transcriptase domain-containing protein [Microvirga calopogonii]|uniref:reverse transcriptase domain-containing protein n=1 Tax=Microvirga calopogonii TaxID=2078013 RepID=UPI000E0DA4FC|nr:reverse transcriptase domain-containing protein [Microvirga calopogonii]
MTGGQSVEVEVVPDGTKGLRRLQKVSKLNENPKWVNRDLYRLMYEPDLYIAAYENIKSSPGNMTAGTDNETIDGFSMKQIDRIIQSMKDQTFTFTRARRTYIPKANGKLRPLGIPSPKDKVVQGVIRMILSIIYDGSKPTFLPCSHGFRANKGTHTALKEVRSWHSVNWFVEGDIKGCFDNIDHGTLIAILSKRIEDQRFLDLIWKALKAGYLEGTTQVNSLAGTPQGSIVSPILANIYLHEFDLWMERFKVANEVGERKRVNPGYTAIVKQRLRLSKKGLSKTSEEMIKLAKELRQTPSLMHNDPGYVRIKYVRYADDWLVAIDGPHGLAEKLKTEATAYFRDELHLELSAEKTHVRQARTEQAKFLGTYVTIGAGDAILRKAKLKDGRFIIRRANVNHLTMMYAPKEELIISLSERGFCDRNGNPAAKTAWTVQDDHMIVERYGQILSGIFNYYSFVDNPLALKHIQHILHFSCAKTLCRKHQTSLAKLFRLRRKNLTVPKRWDKDGKPTAYISLPLRRNWKKNRAAFLINAKVADLILLGIHKRTRSKLDSPCAVCGNSEDVEMHHLRHVRKGRQVGFAAVMAAMNRKQIPVCHTCHIKIHAGKYDGIKLSDFALPKLAKA